MLKDMRRCRITMADGPASEEDSASQRVESVRENCWELGLKLLQGHGRHRRRHDSREGGERKAGKYRNITSLLALSLVAPGCQRQEEPEGCQQVTAQPMRSCAALCVLSQLDPVDKNGFWQCNAVVRGPVRREALRASILRQAM